MRVQVDGMADASRVAAAAEAACSPLYRPPELYEPPHRGQVDGRADVWALGCVLYFLMMCINPFERACQQGASLVLAVQRCASAPPPCPYPPCIAVALAPACTARARAVTCVDHRKPLPVCSSQSGSPCHQGWPCGGSCNGAYGPSRVTGVARVCQQTHQAARFRPRCSTQS